MFFTDNSTNNKHQLSKADRNRESASSKRNHSELWDVRTVWFTNLKYPTINNSIRSVQNYTTENKNSNGQQTIYTRSLYLPR